jgi:hypothetical protein
VCFLSVRNRVAGFGAQWVYPPAHRVVGDTMGLIAVADHQSRHPSCCSCTIILDDVISVLVCTLSCRHPLEPFVLLLSPYAPHLGAQL